MFGTNLAVDCTVTASSAVPDHPASAALDGKYETWWEAAPHGDAMEPVTMDVTLPRFVTFKHVVLQEQIRRSQRVESFTIETQGAEGQWSKLTSASTIGYKRILEVPETTTGHMRVRFDSYRVAPTLAEFELFY
jgi:alpha-L-fucosidase